MGSNRRSFTLGLLVALLSPPTLPSHALDLESCCKVHRSNDGGDDTAGDQNDDNGDQQGNLQQGDENSGANDENAGGGDENAGGDQGDQGNGSRGDEGGNTND
jgi:hypothetical protein